MRTLCVPIVFAALLALGSGVALGLVGGLSLFPADDQPTPPTGLVLGEHQYVIRCLAFSPDGQTLATAGGFEDVSGEVRLWDIATGSERRAFAGSQNGIYALAFSPDGQTLATASFDHTVRSWDVSSGKELQRMVSTLPSAVCLALSPDGQTLALTKIRPQRRDVTLYRMDTQSSEALRGAAGPFAFRAKDSRLVLWQSTTDKFGEGASAPGRALLSTPGVPLAILDNALPPGPEMVRLTADPIVVHALAFAPDGRTLASGGFDESVRLWDTASGRQKLVLHGHADQVGALAFAPDGKLLASGSHDKTVRLWDLTTEREALVLSGHTGTITAVAFSPDGRWLASASHDRSVRLWPLHTEE